MNCAPTKDFSMTENKPTPLFVIDAAPIIKWPVEVILPVDGGETATYKFTGIFKRLSDADLDKLLGIEELKLKPLPEIEPGSSELVVGELVSGEPLQRDKRMSEVLAENAGLFPQILVGWAGVQNAAGEEVAFSIELLQAQVTGQNGRFLSTGLWRAIAEIRHGARLGN